MLWADNRPGLIIQKPRSRRDAIAKNQNTFAKRQREMEKKRKAQEKLSRRMERKLAPDVVEEPELELDEEKAETADEAD